MLECMESLLLANQTHVQMKLARIHRRPRVFQHNFFHLDGNGITINTRKPIPKNYRDELAKLAEETPVMGEFTVADGRSPAMEDTAGA